MTVCPYDCICRVWICLVLRQCNHLRIACSGNRKNVVQNCLSRNKPEWVPTAPQGSKLCISCLHFIGLFPERSVWGGHHYVGGEQAADRWCIVLLHSPAHWRKRLPAGSFMVSKEVIRWRSTNLPAMFPCLKIQGGIIVSYWHGSSTVTLQISYNFRISRCIVIFLLLSATTKRRPHRQVFSKTNSTLKPRLQSAQCHLCERFGAFPRPSDSFPNTPAVANVQRLRWNQSEIFEDTVTYICTVRL